MAASLSWAAEVGSSSSKISRMFFMLRFPFSVVSVRWSGGYRLRIRLVWAAPRTMAASDKFHRHRDRSEKTFSEVECAYQDLGQLGRLRFFGRFPTNRRCRRLRLAAAL